MKKLVLLTALTCSLPLAATETPQEKAQRRCDVVTKHIFPQEKQTTFACAQQEPSTISCIDCQTGETQSWPTPTPFTLPVRHNLNKIGSEFPQRICIEGCAAQTVNLKNLQRPSQTASYLAAFDHKIIEHKLGLKSRQFSTSLHQHAHLISAVAQKENTFADSHYAFYHGMRQNIFIGILLNTKLARTFEKHEAKPNWLKIRKNSDYYSGSLSIVDYLKQNRTILHDHCSPFRENLLSANLSLIANKTYGESSFHYFLSNRSIADSEHTKNVVFDFIKTYVPDYNPLDLANQFSAHITKELNDIIVLINQYTKRGIILQIFIPKNHVDHCIFLCQVTAQPQHWKLKKPYIKGWEDSLKTYTKVTPILEHYQKDCSVFDINDVMNLQVRIRLDQALFNNPKSGVNFYVWHALQPNEYEHIQNKIETLINYILKKGTS